MRNKHIHIYTETYSIPKTPLKTGGGNVFLLYKGSDITILAPRIVGGAFSLMITAESPTYPMENPKRSGYTLNIYIYFVSNFHMRSLDLKNLSI